MVEPLSINKKSHPISSGLAAEKKFSAGGEKEGRRVSTLVCDSIMLRQG